MIQFSSLFYETRPEVKIFKKEHVSETDSKVRVLTADTSPNGVQGMLWYFNLVKGCITVIKSYQAGTETNVNLDHQLYYHFLALISLKISYAMWM
ncbi:hypothetical protein ACET3Z_010563 [Daucus carota]